MTPSLRFRLPAAIGILVAATLGIFVSVSYYQVRSGLLRAGELRASAAADQLSQLLAQTAQQRLTEVRRIARDPAIAEYLAEPAKAGAAAAASQLLATLSPANQPETQLWSDGGEPLLAAHHQTFDERARSLAPSSAPSSEGVSGFGSVASSIFFDVAAAVPAAASTPARPAAFIVSRRILNDGANSEALRRLVGNEASIRLGSTSSGVWSDLAKVVSAPSVQIAPGPVRGDTAADGTRYVGVAAPVRGTPWLVLVQFSEASVVGPALTYAWRMTGVAAVLVLLAGIGAYVVGGRITRPLGRLTFAAEQIAHGEFDTGVTTTRRDEIGRLTAAFVSMASEIRAARTDLELRVEERTRDVVVLNAQLVRRVDELNALTGELEAFSYSVSHDLRAPVRHVGGFAALLEKRAGPALDEESRRYTRLIADAADRMGRLIDDLLAFSRMGRSEMLRTRLDLNALIGSLRRDLVPAGRAVDFVIHPLPAVEGDPAMLRQVFENLLSNAIKYSRDRTPAVVEIGCRELPGEVVIFVRDNGVGFDMAHAGKLFGVFQRLHSAEEFDGTGIGLANVRRIVGRHGGRAWAESSPGQGATFLIALPAIDSLPAAASAAAV